MSATVNVRDRICSGCNTPGRVACFDGVWPAPEAPIGLCEDCLAEALHALEDAT